MPGETTLLEPFKADFETSRRMWQVTDENYDANPHEKHRDDILKDELMYERHMELREVCDELMRIELERLQIELNKLQKSESIKW